MTSPFEVEETEAVETEAAVEADEDFDEDVDLDVEMDNSEDEAEDAPEDTVEGGTKESKEKKAKEPKAPARPPVAEGYITPVAFAKVLTAHLAARGAANKKGPISDTNAIPPQMVYSYMRNNSGGKNPIPVYTDPAVTGGREAVLKTEEALAWWDEKDERIKVSKATKAEKEAAKAEKAAAKATEDANKPVTGEATSAIAEDSGPVEEAE